MFNLPKILGAILVTIIFGLVAVSSLRAQNATPPEPDQATGPPLSVEGRVVSRYGPVKDARVRLPGQSQMALTDAQGRYRFNTNLPLYNRPMVTAGKAGWFNNGVNLNPGGRSADIMLYPVFLRDDPNYRYYSPQVCNQCHGKLTQIWNQSKMAHTTANPLLLEMYYGTQKERLNGKGMAYKLAEPNSQGNCAQCHAPGAASDPKRSRDLNDILRSPRTAWDGISCDYCHKTRKVLPATNAPSGYAPALVRQYPYQGRSILVFGPYSDVVTQPMAASYAPVFGQGEFCATCHGHFQPLPTGKKWNHSKVYTSEEWTGFGLTGNNVLPIQTTYQEWKQWQDSLGPKDPNKGKRCQFCHMSWQKRLLPYDNYVVQGMAQRMFGATYRSPNDIHPHTFEGGTKIQLQNALGLEVLGKIEGDILKVTVRVSNTNGGHWVPTGETMRNILLLVDAKSLEDKPLKLIKGPQLPDWAGQGDPAQGNYAGLPGYAFARVLADDAGHLNVPFWKATRVASDTRVRPKSTVTLKFEYQLTDAADEPSAEARLIYRPVVRSMANIKGWQVKDIPITAKAW
ncbi:MAG: hypothetical protein KQI62_03770 [Deltaproteobacteria bacterium]|nr:hypothetical protein [Deltaproteobacteria bacterium]